MGAELPTRAFVAFTVALAASVWALFADVGRPYLPSVPILVYGIFLYANRDTIAHLASDSLRDSPYFLGFLLTMFALFKLFNDVSFDFAVFGRNPALLTQQVGGAVLTTIIGLFVRQALLLLIPDVPPKEDDRLAALAAAITSHAVAFEQARQDFFRDLAAEQRRHAEALDGLRRQIGAVERREPSPVPGSPAVGPATPYAPPVEVPRDALGRSVVEAPVTAPVAPGALGPYAPMSAQAADAPETEPTDEETRAARLRAAAPPAYLGRDR